MTISMDQHVQLEDAMWSTVMGQGERAAITLRGIKNGWTDPELKIAVLSICARFGQVLIIGRWPEQHEPLEFDTNRTVLGTDGIPQEIALDERFGAKLVVDLTNLMLVQRFQEAESRALAVSSRRVLEHAMVHAIGALSAAVSGFRASRGLL